MDRLMKIEKALKNLKEAAIDHANATEEGNHKLANKSYDVIVKEVKNLKNEDALDYLLKLLNNPNVGVRLFSATFLLPHYEKEAVSILKDIAKRTDIHSLDAEMTLEEWNKGNLDL